MIRNLMLRLASLTVCLSAMLTASADDRYTPLPPELDGSMMPYDFSACGPAPQLPDSLRPVYVAYVARHGARYLSGPKKMEKVLKTLRKAREENALSDTGISFLDLMEQVEKANEDNWGDLSAIGVAEERELGRRMHSVLPALSGDGTAVSCISSYVPRVVMTMYQLTAELVRLNDRITVATDEGHQFSPLVCCFSTDTAYAGYRKSGDWKEVYDRFVKQHVSGEPARRLFTKTDLSDHKLRSLTLDMYEVLKGNRAASLPAPTTQWMSVEEYRACWEASNLQHYLRNTVTPLSSLAAQASTPLLLDVIDNAENALADGKPAVNGYFGHAETLMPLFSLMRLPGCFALPLDYDNLDKEWQVQDVTPLGANLLILISRAPSGTEYATVQHNGRTVCPIKDRPETIPWRELRDYWFTLAAAYAVNGSQE